jgi:catechol 2,3-dioxygenase-like lactoylglutathione lyase family enzyme
MQLDMYLAVEDLNRSIEFYSTILQAEPISRNPNYAAFAVGSSRLGLMATGGYAVPVQRGNSAVPTLKVDDLEAWHSRIKPLAQRTTEIIEKGAFRLFMFLDPDGNVVEVAAVGRAGSPGAQPD